MSNGVDQLTAVLSAQNTKAAEREQKAEEKAAAKASPKVYKSMEEVFKAVKAISAAQDKRNSSTNSIVRMGDKVGEPVPSTPTNLPTVDHHVLGCGGIPEGRIVEIFGPESSGKTTFALHCLAQKQRENAAKGVSKACFFDDAEHALDPDYAAQLGVDMDNLLVSQPDSGEEAIETLISLIEADAINFAVVDSVAALVPKAELEGDVGDSHMGLQARLLSQSCRMLRGIARKHGCTIIFINQIREKIGVMYGSPETTTGGRALKFFSSVRIDVRKTGTKEESEIKSGDVLIGHRVRLRAVKNKVGSPFRETFVDLIYGAGYDIVSDTAKHAVDIGVIGKSGAWYDVPTTGEPQRVQGIKAVKQLVQDDPDVYKHVCSEIAKAHKAMRETEREKS